LDLAPPGDKMTHIYFGSIYQFQGVLTSLTLVPEPSMTALGLCGLGGMRAFKKNRTSVANG
jgi:hypothetical protein